MNLQPILNSIGLIMDIVGACLVAWEVVVQYRGQRMQSSTSVSVETGFGESAIYTPPPEPTSEYVTWEAQKYRTMMIGLGCLVIGFLLQIASNWVSEPSASVSPTQVPSVQTPSAAVR